jgi:TrmH family RNA methyltransferase
LFEIVIIITYNRFMFSVILARPESPENIGLVARAMKNTGFGELRLAGIGRLDPASYRTAVHAKEILDRARLYPGLTDTVADLQLVFAATAKPRKNFRALGLQEAIEKMFRFPASAKIGLLFGNERTGLTSEELKHANFLFTIPQARRQPSYNVSAAVLITLFLVFTYPRQKKAAKLKGPIPRRQQESCIRLILEKLEKNGFIHRTNKQHVTEITHELFGRLAMTGKDRRFLLALFSRGSIGHRKTRYGVGHR